MKKLLLFTILTFWVFISFAQTTPAEVTPNAYITEPYYKTIWGTTADTLSNADTLTFVFRIKGTQMPTFKIGLYSDFVSGSAGGTLIGYGSLNGVNYFSLGDTITVSSLTADGFDTETLDYSNYLWPYLKLIYLQSGTAVTIPKVFVYSKY